MTPRTPDFTFESLRDEITSLRAASGHDDRLVVWADETHVVGVARDQGGRLEIFVVGPPLDASTPIVRDNLEHRSWARASGDALSANRLVLPAAEHFDAVAAFICTELVSHGAHADVRRAFERSEPVIALALERASLGNQELVGLAGELYALARLVQAAPSRALEIVASWHGSGPSTRDLQLGPVGVEIKTTTGSDSVHHVQGLHQVEPGTPVDDQPETHLYLLSIGLEWLPIDASAGQTIPDLVETIALSLPGLEAQRAFLARVRQYGGDAGVGYDHERHREHKRYRRPFHSRFERLYDLTDEQVRLVRRSDVEHARHVDAESMTFRVRLPKKVRGELNPVSGMGPITARLTSLMDG